MTNHRKTRKKMRSQHGGFWPFTSSDPYAQTWGNYFLGLGSNVSYKAKGIVNDLNTDIGNVVASGMNAIKNTASNVTSTVSAPTSFPEPAPTSFPEPSHTQPNTYGGKLGRIKKGGKGGLGLTYYASPVSWLKVAEPTSWQYYANGTNQYSVKGGSTKRNKRKSRKNKKL